MINIDNDFKIFDAYKSPYEYFNKLFNDEIKEFKKSMKVFYHNDNFVVKNPSTKKIDWMDTILEQMYKIKHFIKSQQYFHDFISFLNVELIRLGQNFVDLDTCYYFLDQHIQQRRNNRKNSKNASLIKSFFYVFCLITRILPEDKIIHSMSALFDTPIDNVLTKSNNIISLITDIQNKKNNINTGFPINMILKFLLKLNDKVNEYRKYFNSCKHNFTNQKINEFKNKGKIMEIKNWQNVFNVWFILINFILPALKVLFAWDLSNGEDENMLKRRIGFDISLEFIFNKLLNNN